MTSRPRHTPRLPTLCSTRAMEALLCTFTVLCSFTGGVAFVTSVQQAGLGQRRPTPQLSSTKSSGESSTPSWRYEMDDLVKAASPWGSLVEAEIIATDLGTAFRRDSSEGRGNREFKRGVVAAQGTRGVFLPLLCFVFCLHSVETTLGRIPLPPRLTVYDTQCHSIISHATSMLGGVLLAARVCVEFASETTAGYCGRCTSFC